MSCVANFHPSLEAVAIAAAAGPRTKFHLMLDLLQMLLEAVPDIKVDIYVDNVNLEATLPNPAALAGTIAGKARERMAQRVAQQLERCAGLIAKAVDTCSNFFEKRHGMKLSAAKSCFIASHAPVAARAATLTRCAGIKSTARGKMLGYETAAGRGRAMTGIRIRIARFRVKARRIKVLRGASINAKLVTRATGMPAMAYGLDAVAPVTPH